MAIIKKDKEAIGKKAAYVDKMIEIYYKTKENLVARFGQECFDNKIGETVAMLPDGNKSLLMSGTTLMRMTRAVLWEMSSSYCIK